MDFEFEILTGFEKEQSLGFECKNFVNNFLQRPLASLALEINLKTPRLK